MQIIVLAFSVANGIEKLNVNNGENHTIQAGERAALTARITELQEKLNSYDER